MSTNGELVALARQGHPEALDRLAAVHRPAVYRTAAHILGDPDAADDVAQDAFVRLQAALPGFRGESELATWLYRVTLNLCRDHLRRRRRERARAPDAEPSREGGPAPPPDARLDVERARAAVRAAVAKLPDEQRDAVTLRYLSGLSYAEIARVTRTPQGTVASRVFRALRRLGEDLENHHLELIR